MILRKLSEARKKSPNGELVSEIKEKCSELSDFRDTTIENIISIYKDEFIDSEIELKPDDIISWFRESETLAEFVFFYGDSLYTYSIEDFAKHDEKLTKAVKQVLIDNGIIDKNGIDLTTANERPEDKSKKLNLLQMCTIIFDTWTEKGVRDANINISEIDPKDLSHKTIKDPKARHENLAKVEEAYHKLFESLKEEHVCEKCGKSPCICEETEDVVSPEGVTFDLSNGIDEPKEVTVKPEVIEEPKVEVEPEIKETAFSELINSAIQAQWDIISQLNGIIATIDYEYKETNKEDLLSVLNQLVDDNTISVGMLHKASELISNRAAELLDAGVEKAEEIIEG